MSHGPSRRGQGAGRGPWVAPAPCWCLGAPSFSSLLTCVGTSAGSLTPSPRVGAAKQVQFFLGSRPVCPSADEAALQPAASRLTVPPVSRAVSSAAGPPTHTWLTCPESPSATPWGSSVSARCSGPFPSGGCSATPMS